MIMFYVHGDAVPYTRVVPSKFGKPFTPPKAAAYKAAIQIEAMKHAPDVLLEGPIEVNLKVSKAVPASWSKKKQFQALTGAVRPTAKPDIDNLYKIVADALNGIIWRDDAQVVSITAEKWYSERPGICVEIRQA